MKFLNIDDFKAVVDSVTLDVIHQSDTLNLARAENYALEEISSYLRGRYDMAAAFASTTTRNNQLVMVCADITLYHLISWLPKRIGFEIRETRFKSALDWLKDVQAGKATPDLPLITDDAGTDIGTPIKFGSRPKATNDY